MNFSDYDRVADTLLYLSDSITLEFIVMLSSANKYGERSFFHTESEYDTNKFTDVGKGHSIKRRMNFYFVFANKKYFSSGVILRPEDIAMLKMLIDKHFLNYYFDKSKRIFSIIDNKLTITGKFNPIDFYKDQNNFIKFTPIVNEYENGLYKEGVRIDINDDYVDIDIDKFMGLYKLLFDTDMYATACSILAYAKTEPYNVNMWEKSGLGSIYNGSDDIPPNTQREQSILKPAFLEGRPSKKKGE